MAGLAGDGPAKSAARLAPTPLSFLAAQRRPSRQVRSRGPDGK